MGILRKLIDRFTKTEYRVVKFPNGKFGVECSNWKTKQYWSIHCGWVENPLEFSSAQYDEVLEVQEIVDFLKKDFPTLKIETY